MSLFEKVNVLSVIYFCLGIAVICTLLLYLAYTLISWYKSCSKKRNAFSSFILSNKEVSAWLSDNYFPVRSYSFTLKAMMKVLNDGIAYKDLSKAERSAIRGFDFIIFMREGLTFTLKQILLDVFRSLFDDNKKHLDNPFRSMRVTLNKSLTCLSNGSKTEVSKESILMNITLSARALDEKGMVDFNACSLTQKRNCSQCKTTWHDEDNTTTSVSAKQYFIIKMIVGDEIKGTTIQFKDKYFTASEKTANIVPNAYEIVSILLIQKSRLPPSEVFYILNEGQPLVFTDTNEEDAFYCMMKEIPQLNN
ncbi:hypothetical protein ENBRE01_2578 [Enteropsectra breve]|nr:hypothetical protein ENBRE01_2578 [Enteropsectra breve]